jgi:hypothetical protein
MRPDCVHDYGAEVLEMRSCYPHDCSYTARLSSVPGIRLRQLLDLSASLAPRDVEHPAADLQRRQRAIGDVILRTVEEMTAERMSA